MAAGSLWSGYLLSLRADEGTLILDGQADRRWFYTPDDPLELAPPPQVLPESSRETAERLEEILRALPPPARDPSWELSDEELQRLRSLGYLVD